MGAVEEESASTASTASAAGANDRHSAEDVGFRAAATDTTAAEKLKDALWSTRFEALVNATYHTDREAFLALVARSSAAFSVVAGSGAAALAVGKSEFTPWLALAVAVAGTINLVFAPAQSARDSRDLRRRYLDLYTRMESGEVTDPAKARAEFLKISADAPPACSAARAIAWNRVIAGLYKGGERESMMMRVPWYDRLTPFLMRRPHADYATKPRG